MTYVWNPKAGWLPNDALLYFLLLIKKYGTFVCFSLQSFSSHIRTLNGNQNTVSVLFYHVFPSSAIFLCDWASSSLGRDVQSTASLASVPSPLSSDPLAGHDPSGCRCAGILFCSDLCVQRKTWNEIWPLHMSNEVKLKDTALPSRGYRYDF